MRTKFRWECEPKSDCGSIELFSPRGSSLKTFYLVKKKKEVFWGYSKILIYLLKKKVKGFGGVRLKFWFNRKNWVVIIWKLF